MRWLFALALGLTACVSFDPAPHPDAAKRPDGEPGTADDSTIPDAPPDAPTDAPSTIDGMPLVEQ